MSLATIPDTIRHVITFTIGTIILLYALGIFTTQLQLVVIGIALLLMISSFIALGGITKIMKLFCAKKPLYHEKETTREPEKNDDDLF